MGNTIIIVFRELKRKKLTKLHTSHTCMLLAICSLVLSLLHRFLLFYRLYSQGYFLLTPSLRDLIQHYNSRYTNMPLTTKAVSKEQTFFLSYRPYFSYFQLPTPFLQMDAPRAVHLSTSKREYIVFSTKLAPSSVLTPSIHGSHQGFLPLPRISYPFKVWSILPPPYLSNLSAPPHGHHCNSTLS